jgi:hypothetical protein
MKNNFYMLRTWTGASAFGIAGSWYIISRIWPLPMKDRGEASRSCLAIKIQIVMLFYTCDPTSALFASIGIFTGEATAR